MSPELPGIALATAGGEKAEKLFLKDLKSDDIEIISFAIENLGRTKRESAYMTVLSYKKHPESEIRIAVARALGDFNTDDAIDHLRQMMYTDDDDRVRSQASTELLYLGLFLSAERAIDLAKKEAEKLGYDTNELSRYRYLNELGPRCSVLVDDEFKNRLLDVQYWTVHFTEKLPLNDKLRQEAMLKSKINICVFINAETKEPMRVEQSGRFD